tara:strand:- start:835 stop:1308 length:474 start_codon:yes stop_codon:yes gene_type:complete
MKDLAKKVIKRLIKKKTRISFAESCTGGLLSSTITSISGSSKVFNLGLITYSNNAKISILNVPKKILLKYGAVSYQTCLFMVKNLSKISRNNICISITGIAGPKGGSKMKPIGLVFIGIKINKTILIKKYIFKSKLRDKIQKDTVKKALSLILKIVK